MASVRNRLGRAWLTGAILLAAFASLAVLLWSTEASSRRQQQRSRERAVEIALAQQVREVLTHEHELATLVGSLHTPVGDRWRVFTQPLLTDPATSGVGLVDVVPARGLGRWQRAHHVEVVAASSPGVFHRAPPRAVHWVGTEAISRPGSPRGRIGLDLAADPVRRRLLGLAARENAAVASAPTRVLSSASRQPAVIVFDPVRRPDGSLRGWVDAAYQPDTLSSIALAVDRSARIVIHDDGRTLAGSSLPGGAITDGLAVAGRVWSVGVWSPPGASSLLPLILLILGAILAAAITQVVRLGDGRERYALELVEHHVGREREARLVVEGALERLRQNERRLTETQALAHLGSWELDPRTGRLHWSRELSAIAGQPEGYSPTYGEFLAQIHPEDRAGLEAAVRQAEHRTPSVSEYRIIRPDGEVRWVRTSRFVDDDPDGRPRLRGATQDITAAKHAELELHRAREHSEAITEAIAEGYGLTIDGRIARVNASLCEMTGFSAEELVGSAAPFPFWPPEHVEANLAKRDQVVTAGGETFELTLMRKDGSRFQAELTARRAHNPDGGVLGFVTTIRDISAQKRRQLEDRMMRELAQLVATKASPAEVFDRVARQLRELFDSHSGVVLRFDHENRRAVFLTGATRSAHHVAGSELDLTGHSAPATVFATGASARSKGRRTVGADPRIDDFVGELTDAVAAPITVSGQLWGCVGVAFDNGPAPVDAEERLERFADTVAMAIANAQAWDTLARQALTDSLTGLGNRRSFQIRLRAEVNRAARYRRDLTLVLLDVDHFKAVNDTYGHQTGDRVLRQLAELLCRHARDGDLVARTGGEEFAWLMPETDAPAALRAVERIRTEVAATSFGPLPGLTISAGVRAFEAGLDGSRLFRDADRALYDAKNTGRNRCLIFLPEPGLSQPGPPEPSRPEPAGDGVSTV